MLSFVKAVVATGIIRTAERARKLTSRALWYSGYVLKFTTRPFLTISALQTLETCLWQLKYFSSAVQNFILEETSLGLYNQQQKFKTLRGTVTRCCGITRWWFKKMIRQRNQCCLGCGLWGRSRDSFFWGIVLAERMGGIWLHLMTSRLSHFQITEFQISAWNLSGDKNPCISYLLAYNQKKLYSFNNQRLGWPSGQVLDAKKKTRHA